MQRALLSDLSLATANRSQAQVKAHLFWRTPDFMKIPFIYLEFSLNATNLNIDGHTSSTQ